MIPSGMGHTRQKVRNNLCRCDAPSSLDAPPETVWVATASLCSTPGNSLMGQRSRRARWSCSGSLLSSVGMRQGVSTLGGGVPPHGLFFLAARIAFPGDNGQNLKSNLKTNKIEVK